MTLQQQPRRVRSSGCGGERIAREHERGTRVAGRGHSVVARRRAHAQTRTETRAAAPCGPAIILRFRPAPGLLLHNHNRLLGGHSGCGEPFETSSPPSPAGAQGRPQCASRQAHSLPASTERNPLVFDAIVSVLPPRFPASTERNPSPTSPTVGELLQCCENVRV